VFTWLLKCIYISPPEGVSISSPDASGDLGDEGILGG